MSSNWQEITIEEIKDSSTYSIAMGPFGSNIKTDNFVSSGVPVIRGVNLNGDRFNDDDFVFVKDEKANELKSANAFPGDIVFTHRGTLGQVGIIPFNAKYERYVVSQSQMKLRVNPKKADPVFIFYFFKSPQGQFALLTNTSTTGVPAISSPLTSLRSIKIPLPPLAEQRAIAGVLGALDDKIELNRRMNATLEALAAALFKHWFVDNPEAEGWEVGKLGDIANNIRQGAQPDEIEPTTPYIGLEHMPRQSIALSEWGTASEVKSNKFWFRKGEFLFGKLRPYFHKVGVAPIDGVCSTDILVIAPKSIEWYGLVLSHISSIELIRYTDMASSGTKMPRTSWQDIERYEITIPPKNLAQSFTNLVMPMVQQIRVNIIQSRTLAALRDTLLPKLMRGEVRVSEL